MAIESNPGDMIPLAATCPQFSRCSRITEQQCGDFPRTPNAVINARLGFAIALRRQRAIERDEQCAPSMDKLCGEGCPRWIPSVVIEYPEAQVSMRTLE